MNLLIGKHYDPSTAVSKSTASLLAMTAFDTTNLRLSFTVPPSGQVLVRMRTNLSGATTMPQVQLGVLESSTVRGRQVALGALPGTAVATTNVSLFAEFLVTGLTPGASLTWDAAYGVETVVAATNIHYGGPNNATANDAWGGFTFEIWDPCPVYTPSSGAAPTNTAHVKLDAIDDFIDTEVAAILAAVDTEVAAIKAKTDNLPASPAATGDAMDLVVDAVDSVSVASSGANELADALLDRLSAIEGFTPREAGRLILAALCGKASGFPGGPVNYRNIADTKNRIQATVSAGNRTAVTLDAT